jgi:hypothetical protein
MRVYAKFIGLIIMAVTCFTCNHMDVSRDSLSASIDGDNLKLINNSNNQYYYAVMGQKYSAYVDWGVICGSSNSLQPYSNKLSSIENIGKDTLDSTFIIYYWQKESENMPCSSHIDNLVIKFR